MPELENNPLRLLEETLITLYDAAADFGGAVISIATVRSYVYQGWQGIKLETIMLNRRYTSEEAILRFLERIQSLHQQPQKTKTQNVTQARLRNTWRGMIRRCTNENCSGWKSYGGRGITVCEEWKNSFIVFRDWSLANGYSDSLEIDRINNDAILLFFLQHQMGRFLCAVCALNICCIDQTYHIE